MANGTYSQYAKPVNPLGSFIEFLDADQQLLVIDNLSSEECNDDEVYFKGTPAELVEFDKDRAQHLKPRLLEFPVKRTTICAGNILCIIIDRNSEDAPKYRNQIDFITSEFCVPRSVLQTTKIRDLLLLLRGDTPVQVVTETAGGSMWKVIARGTVNECTLQIKNKRYGDELIVCLSLEDGYVTIGVRDRTLT